LKAHVVGHRGLCRGALRNGHDGGRRVVALAQLAQVTAGEASSRTVRRM